MRELSVSTDVKAPGGFALAFLTTYVSDRAAAGHDGDAQLSLRFPLQHLFGGLVLEREVTVQVSYLPNAPGEMPRLSICWRPEDTSLFPSFEGRVEATDVAAHDCTLAIVGTYDVPLGVAGALFDAVIGVRIARGTLEGLLAEFKAEIENDYFKRVGSY